ncbi:MAG TPA: thiamine pyrophosphate-binding protein [Caulobacterales bacterium]|nr:thiamine pyrophosphate-binding protein [Caulobacterales bacterium]
MQYIHSIVRAFRDRGVDRTFSLMGDGDMYFQVAFKAAGGRIYNARHEAAALNMADGYARATGRVGVCTVTRGPGLAQLATPLLVAARFGSPIVIFCGTSPKGNMQELDQARFMEACESLYVEADGTKSAREVVESVFELAETQRRPVALAISDRVQLMTDPFPPSAARATRDGNSAPAPIDANELAAAVRVADAARAPIIIAGRGVSTPQALAAVEKLAERLGAPVSTTLLGMGHQFSSHLPHLGLTGGCSLPATERIVAKADLVIAVGLSMAVGTSRSGKLFTQDKVLRIDNDPAIKEGGTIVHGDAEEALSAIADALPRANNRNAAWRDYVAGELSRDQRLEELEEYSPAIDPGTVDPRRLIMGLDEVIPDDAVVVIGGGHSLAFPPTFLSVRRRTFISSYSFGAIGQTFPTAIGVATAITDRPVVGFEGDVGFFMHLQELDTAVREKVNLTYVLMNDEAIGAEYHRLQNENLDYQMAQVPTPSFDEVTRAFGGRGYRIEAEDQIRPVGAAALAASGFRLIDARTSRTVVSRHFRVARVHLDKPVAAAAAS